MSAPTSAQALGVNPFADTEDQASLRQLARDVAERSLAPMARQGDETEEFPQASWDAIKQAELFGITIGEKWGGAGLGDVEASIVLEELGRADVSSAILAQLIFNGPPRAIEHLGNDEMRDRWLPVAASGDGLFCIGISETEAGSNVGQMRAKLTPDGEGFRLNAYKNYVTGGHKSVACLVWCRFPESAGTKGIGAVLVDLSAPGVTVAGTHVKMGLRATSEAELAFDDVRVEPSDVLVWGDPANSESFKTLISHINHERCGNAAMCVGAAQGALEYAVQYMSERKTGDKTLADLQGLQWKIADMATQLEGARLLLQRAVRMAGPHGTPPALETAMAKTAANLAAKFVCDEAIQLLGGYGFSREYPVERVYRDIRGLCIGAGTVEIQRNFIGTSVLRGATPASDGWKLRRAEPAAPVLEPTFHSPVADAYRQPGGVWDAPSLDELLTGRADDALADRVARVAGGLRAQGVEPGDAVAWQSHNRDEITLLFRARWRLGAIAAPLHHQLGAQEVERSRAAVAPKVVVADLDVLPDGPPVTELWTEREQLAAVLFTSGSSGTPKGVLHTQATLAYKAALMAGVHALRTDDCVLMPAPGAHISGLLNGVTLAGAVPFRTVFMARWDPETALDLIERERVTYMVGPPTFFVSLMQAPGFTPARVESLRLISSGGAGVSVAFVEEASATLGAVVKRTYGSTEAPSIATSIGGDDPAEARTHDGRAVGQVELRIVDGELLVRGPEVCVGYLDAAQNEGAFDADGWFHTGDLAAIDPDGWLAIVGRLKDVIIRGGENISTAEVEAELEAHTNVREAVVVGVPDDLMGERVAAFVIGAPSFDVDAARAWFAARGVARFKTPERVIVVDEIPTLATGKPDRDALRAQITDG